MTIWCKIDRCSIATKSVSAAVVEITGLKDGQIIGDCAGNATEVGRPGALDAVKSQCSNFELYPLRHLSGDQPGRFEYNPARNPHFKNMKNNSHCVTTSVRKGGINCTDRQVLEEDREARVRLVNPDQSGLYAIQHSLARVTGREVRLHLKYCVSLSGGTCVYYNLLFTIIIIKSFLY